jgi:hypothetical protein
MKNIFKYLFVFIAAGALFVSCNEESNFAALTKAPDANAEYYVQFIDAAKTMETGVSLDGDLVEIQTTVAVSLMGMPQANDIDVNFTVDPSSTIDPSMYTMSANSITIPAGKTSGSVTFSTIAANMPVGTPLKFVLNLDAGTHNSPAAAGTKLVYDLLRIKFCPLENGAADLVGSWAGTDGTFWASQVTTTLNGDNLDVTGLSFPMITGWWGESIIEGGTFTMNVAGNGKVDIPRQHIYTTEWSGAPYRYDVEGSGTWTNCGDKPTLLITYDIYYEGDADGLAKTYASYLDGTGFFLLDVELGGGKKAVVTEMPTKVAR